MLRVWVQPLRHHHPRPRGLASHGGDVLPHGFPPPRPGEDTHLGSSGGGGGLWAPAQERGTPAVIPDPRAFVHGASTLPVASPVALDG